VQFWSILPFVVFFKATKYWIDIRLVDLSATLNPKFFAELFVVAAAESTDRIAIYAAKLTTRIVVVKNILGRVLLVSSFAITAFDNMNAIVFTIK
jgi:hypothetical protein